MRILLDECIPRRLKNSLLGHDVKTVVEMGWSGIKNGALISKAKSLFDVFLTVDQNMQYQQNLTKSDIGVIILSAKSNDIADLEPLMPKVIALLSSVEKGRNYILAQ